MHTSPTTHTNTHIILHTNQIARTLSEDADSKIPVKYALVIDGKALLYALSPMLRDLFLEVGDLNAI